MLTRFPHIFTARCKYPATQRRTGHRSGVQLQISGHIDGNKSTRKPTELHLAETHHGLLLHGCTVLRLDCERNWISLQFRPRQPARAQWNHDRQSSSEWTGTTNFVLGRPANCYHRRHHTRFGNRIVLEAHCLLRRVFLF